MTARGWSHYRLEFRRVKWPTMEEGAAWSQITGGRVEMSALSDLKVSATLDFKCLEVPDDRDLVRIYAAYTPNGGEEVMFPVATLMFSVSQPRHRGVMVTGTMECQSVLSVLSSKSHGAPYTVPAGTNAVALAVEIAESLGIRTNRPSSGYVTKQERTFPTDKANYLSIVNWLLDAAGYASADVDAYGTVQMRPYVEPTERGAMLALTEGDDSIMYPEIIKRSEYADTPNVVRLYYETDAEAITASASNVDPDSRASLPVRGFEVTYCETVTELEGGTAAERLANLMALAKQRLIDKSSDIEYVDGRCQHVPEMAPGNAVSVDYGTAGLDWSGAITNATLQLSKSMPVDFSARRFVRGDLKIETAGEILWEVTAVE